MKVRLLAVLLLFSGNAATCNWVSQAIVEHPQAAQESSSTSTVAAALVVAAYTAHRTYQYFAHKAIANAPKKKIAETHNDQQSPIVIQALHGMGGYSHNMQNYVMKKSLIPADVHAIDFPSSALIGRPGHLAQDGNINCVVRGYQTLSNAGNNVIFYGVSDGAATGITTLGSYTFKNVKAAILESPYADIKQTVRRVLRRIYCHWIPGIGTLGSLIVSMIHSGYSPYGIRPIDVAYKIQHDIPILLVCVKNDIITPEEGTIELYNALKKAGHKKVHILILENGDHGFLLCGKDSNLYKATMHAFLRHYRLPHDPELAAQSTHKDFVR